MNEFDKIYLSWRKGQGSRRHIVGVIQKTQYGSYQFSYDQNAIAKAKEEGFGPYTEFPDITKSYNGSVLDIFAQRLIKSERPDIQSFYDFWEIEPQFVEDKFYLLAHTQGLVPTDNFEFLADYNLVPGLHFVTELAGLSSYKLSPDLLSHNDLLRYELDLNNEYDNEAVKVFKGDIEIGYLKKIHCRVFRKSGADKLKLSVKEVEKNGFLKRVFIKVSF